MPSFSADAMADLAGPEWLRARRQAAYERFATAPVPTPEEEVWRYSRVGELDLDRYQPARNDPAVATKSHDWLAGPEDRAATVLVVDGRVVSVELDESLSAKGLQVGRLADLDPTGQSLGSVGGASTDAFGLLHDAMTNEPVLVRVPAGMSVEAPVVVVHQAVTNDAASFPHLVVHADEDSDLTVLDLQTSADVAALVVPVVELEAGPAARLRYLNAQLLGLRVWQLGRQSSRVGKDASLLTTMVALGGDYARLSIDSTMEGRGGSGEMLAAYFGEAGQMHDFRTLQDHVAPATTSNLLFKGVVEGHARAVYTGLIHIGKEAAGVNAFQTNRNVKLSADAWAESVPNLEIENNDVHCSHASAVGPVDEDQLFYLESRGVPPQVAERLIVLGFFDEVLERLPVPAVAGLLRAEMAAKLDRRDP